MNICIPRANFVCCKFPNKGSTTLAKCDGFILQEAPRESVVVRRKVIGPLTVDYVQKLGINAHCMDILELLDEHRAMDMYAGERAKAREVAIRTKEKIMDLFLILDAWSVGKEDLHAERLAHLNEETNG